MHGQFSASNYYFIASAIGICFVFASKNRNVSVSELQYVVVCLVINDVIGFS